MKPELGHSYQFAIRRRTKAKMTPFVYRGKLVDEDEDYLRFASLDQLGVFIRVERAVVDPESWEEISNT